LTFLLAREKFAQCPAAVECLDHNFRIFFIGKGSFYQTLGKARKIPGLLLYNYHLLLEG
jgi:hypothetical protein